MFLVGVYLDLSELRRHGHAALLTSHVSIVTPFCMGAALALMLYRPLSNAGISFMSFALFMGAAMSVTAFPVLARILTERDLLRSRMGMLAITCAAVDDITGWCILAYIVVFIRSEKASMPAWATIGGAVAYVLVMLLGVRRLMPRFEAHFRKEGRHTESAISLMIVLALASALATEWLGIHLVFGAFLMGAIMPKSPEFIRSLQHKMEPVTVVVLLPLFFAFSGLRTNIGAMKGGLWLYFLAVMNTRGLMGLIALNIGLDIGVISGTVFSMMVLMAVVTTFMTSPLLEWVYPRRLAVVEADRPAQEIA